MRPLSVRVIVLSFELRRGYKTSTAERDIISARAGVVAGGRWLHSGISSGSRGREGQCGVVRVGPRERT